MKAGPLLLVTAMLEGPLGLVLMLFPDAVVNLLLGAPLDTPAALVVARVAGAALLTMGVACWLLRKQDSGATRAMVTAVTVYNGTVIAVLVHAAVGYGLSGSGLWPAVVLHVAQTLWCVRCLLPIPIQPPTR